MPDVRFWKNCLLPLEADIQQGVQRRNGEVREDYSVTVPERRTTKPEKTSAVR